MTAKVSGVGPVAVMMTGAPAAQKFNAAGLLLECSNGTAALAAIALVGSSGVINTQAVHGGDEILAKVTTNATTTEAEVRDLTAGNTFTIKSLGPGAPSLEELIMDDSLVTGGGVQLPVANFENIDFTAGRVGGEPLGMVLPRARVDMGTTAGVLQILTGRLRGSLQDRFSTSWMHA